jgi:hypothetical protein
MCNVKPDLVLAPRVEHMPSLEIGYSLLKRLMTTNPKLLSTRFLVNDQLDAQFFSIYKYLFQFSTCFEQPSAHHQKSQLYQYTHRIRTAVLDVFV